MTRSAVWILRTIVLLPVLYLLYASQRHWLERVWRLTGHVTHASWRRLLRAGWLLILFALILPSFIWLATGSRRPLPNTPSFAISGLWLSSALAAWVGMRFVAGAEWLWTRLRRDGKKPEPVSVSPVDPSRRYFFQTAGYVAGAVPFVGAFYGFLFERLKYRVERVEVPLPALPAALDGLRIVQISDIHSGGYMPRDQIRRAVDMANELGADLIVVTGDFITGRNDPLDECIAELAALRAPLGVWGCNGNHEIYANAEERAAKLFAQGGMRLLRQASAEVVWENQPLNLIGVDYQMSRGPWGQRRRSPMLVSIESLVRRDVPNVLLSHNPNAFPRAAQLGIELTLAGHTHGGQVQVEILHERLNPARFFTEFIAGLFQRPVPGGQSLLAGDGPSLGVRHSALVTRNDSPSNPEEPRRIAHLYVNRGLGTIGTPVRFNSPPEITLLTLRKA